MSQTIQSDILLRVQYKLNILYERIRFALYKEISHIIGSTLRSRTSEVKAQILKELVGKVFPKIETGEILPTIYATLPITEAEAAHDILYKGENVGKVVLEVR